MFGFYALLAIIGNYLAIEGWRQAGTRVQPIVEGTRDWPGIAAGWMDRVAQERWWCDPTLDLAGLARRLGTNTAYLSRGLNEGLGLGFADAINGLRLDDAAARLRRPGSDDILDIALASGFGSKATFNRVFKDRFGQTPSAYRRVSTAKNDPSRPDVQRTG